jgi:hypothetical protein
MPLAVGLNCVQSNLGACNSFTACRIRQNRPHTQNFSGFDSHHFPLGNGAQWSGIWLLTRLNSPRGLLTRIRT